MYWHYKPPRSINGYGELLGKTTMLRGWWWGVTCWGDSKLKPACPSNMTILDVSQLFFNGKTNEMILAIY